MTEDSLFDPRNLEFTPFDELMRAATEEEDLAESAESAAPEEWKKPKKPTKPKGKKKKRHLGTKAEWKHAMVMEFLRVPIMIPVWWAGMALCDILWKLR